MGARNASYGRHDVWTTLAPSPYHSIIVQRTKKLELFCLPCKLISCYNNSSSSAAPLSASVSLSGAGISSDVMEGSSGEDDGLVIEARKHLDDL